MSSYDVDLFVIGAGSGGVRAARIAAAHGARVAIAEQKNFGGTCVNVGCVPKKIMTYVSSYATAMNDASGYGWNIGERSLDWQNFITRKNQEISRLNGIYEKMLINAGVQIHTGAAIITSPHSVQVADKKITAENILIATGGKPEIPKIKGALEHGITSDEIFYLKSLPKKVAIMGAGFIALEFAGIFRALGTEVHLVFRRDKILNESFDEDIRSFLQNELAKKGIILHPSSNITEVELAKIGYSISINGNLINGLDQVIFATGRKPNTENLGLDKLAINMDKSGAILVNTEDQTNIPSLYAIGDVTNRVNLTPVALAQGHAFANRLYGNKVRHVSFENIPSAVFSDPPLAQVGLTEHQARLLHDDIDIYKADFRPMRMILANRDERTLMKLVVQRSTDKVLGLHMAGQDAPEIVQGFTTALIAGATKSDFDRTIGIHPTAAEEFVTMCTKSAF